MFSDRSPETGNTVANRDPQVCALDVTPLAVGDVSFNLVIQINSGSQNVFEYYFRTYVFLCAVYIITWVQYSVRVSVNPHSSCHNEQLN